MTVVSALSGDGCVRASGTVGQLEVAVQTFGEARLSAIVYYGSSSQVHRTRLGSGSVTPG